MGREIHKHLCVALIPTDLQEVKIILLPFYMWIIKKIKYIETKQNTGKGVEGYRLKGI